MKIDNIAQRIAAITDATNIIVLDDDEIVAEGKYEHLLTESAI